MGVKLNKLFHDTTRTILLRCPYCDNEATYVNGSDGQADAIYCNECPLGVEHVGMSYNALAVVWNGIPRRKANSDDQA